MPGVAELDFGDFGVASGDGGEAGEEAGGGEGLGDGGVAGGAFWVAGAGVVVCVDGLEVDAGGHASGRWRMIFTRPGKFLGIIGKGWACFMTFPI